MIARLQSILLRISRALAGRVTNCAVIGVDIEILCLCGKWAGLINQDAALHGQCTKCGQHYSGALFVRASDEPVPWKKTP